MVLPINFYRRKETQGKKSQLCDVNAIVLEEIKAYGNLALQHAVRPKTAYSRHGLRVDNWVLVLSPLPYLLLAHQSIGFSFASRTYQNCVLEKTQPPKSNPRCSAILFLSLRPHLII